MPVTDKHKQFEAMGSTWRDCRIVVDGAKAVKAAGTEYLPMLSGQSQEQYDVYRRRALFYNATSRSVDTVCGMVFRKDPQVEGPDGIEDLLDLASATYGSFSDLCQILFREVVSVSRYGILIDLPSEVVGAAPYFVGYAAEQITNWRWSMVDGQPVTTLVVLEERYSVQGEDLFADEEKLRYRVLFMDCGVYKQQIWEESMESRDRAQKDYVAQPEIIPRVYGSPMSSIPFIFFGGDGNVPDVVTPILADLVDTNISHYLTSADLEHGRHFTSLPTPWAVGFPETSELYIGSSCAWVSSDPQARAGFLEFSGAGLASLERALEEKEKKMSAILVRMMEAPQRTETATAFLLRQSGEMGVIQSMAQDASRGLTNCARWLWTMNNGMVSEDSLNEIEIELNTEFIAVQPDSQLIDSMVRAMQAGTMRKETIVYQMERMGLLPPGTDYKQEVVDLEAEEGDGYTNLPIQDATTEMPTDMRDEITQDTAEDASDSEEVI